LTPALLFSIIQVSVILIENIAFDAIRVPSFTAPFLGGIFGWKNGKRRGFILALLYSYVIAQQNNQTNSSKEETNT
jgi:hypothetical protein